MASDTDLKHGAFDKRIDTLKDDVAKRAEQINADMDRLTKPGLFRDVDHRRILERSFKVSGIHFALDDFKAALDRAG